MGLIKKLKGSYMFTHMEVGKYTKRRTNNTPDAKGFGQHGNEFIDEFDRAAEELRQEEEELARQRHKQRMDRQNSSATLGSRPANGLMSPGAPPQVQRFQSTIELSSGVMSPPATLSRATTAVSTPQASPFDDISASSFPTNRPLPRARPRGARTARSAADMQSVYFAPGRNIPASQQKQQQPANALKFDKMSASSMDYYVYTPTRQEISALPLEARRKGHRGVVAPENRLAAQIHKDELKTPEATSNPFIERRRRAEQRTAEGYDSASPFDDPLVGSGRGGIDPDQPRKYLNTPVYANQAGSYGLDLLA